MKFALDLQRTCSPFNTLEYPAALKNYQMNSTNPESLSELLFSVLEKYLHFHFLTLTVICYRWSRYAV